MSIELRPAGSTANHPELEQYEWGEPRSGSAIKSTVDAWLTQMGSVSSPAVDLTRIATAAYIADRMQRRRTGFTRTIRLHAQLCDPGVFEPLLPRIEALLHWISGDDWSISVSSDEQDQPAAVSNGVSKFTKIALLSGGLDSFCGALLNPERSLFLSHTDNPTVTGSQRRAWAWLSEGGHVKGRNIRIFLAQETPKKERSTRTRSVLFYALAVALADANGVTRIEIPENGFTSLNVPLGGDRGGVLSTRSTHPWTLHLVRQLLDELGLSVKFLNPYEMLTKGELIRRARVATEDFDAGAAITLSCAKLDGRFFTGNPHHNCGLCVACLTRRGGLILGGAEDLTPYLANTVPQPWRDRLRARRRGDIEAVLAGLSRNLDEFTLVSLSQFPDDFDLVAGESLVRRGFAELDAIVETI